MFFITLHYCPLLCTLLTGHDMVRRADRSNGTVQEDSQGPETARTECLGENRVDISQARARTDQLKSRRIFAVEGVISNVWKRQEADQRDPPLMPLEEVLVTAQGDPAMHVRGQRRKKTRERWELKHSKGQLGTQLIFRIESNSTIGSILSVRTFEFERVWSGHLETTCQDTQLCCRQSCYVDTAKEDA